MYPRKDNTLSMLAGAAVGAVAMYLLDPDAGAKRRHNIATKADDATTRASDAITPLWDRVSDTAKSFGATVAGSAGTLGHNLAEHFEHARESGRHSVAHLGEQASDLGGSLADQIKRAASHARKSAANVTPSQWFHREPPPSHAGMYAGIGAGTLLLGAAAMFFLDPERGRARRAMVADRASSACRRTGKTAWKLGKDLRDRAAGYAHETRGWMSLRNEAVSAEQLLERVRADLAHVVSYPAAIQVMTDNQGRVTLHGKVLVSEIDRLLSTVKSVTGVNEVINLVSVKETEQQMREPADADVNTPISQL